MSSPPIEVHNLSKTYRDGLFRRRQVDALSGVSLEVRPGEIFGLLGPNGAGKTTFIKVLLGIVSRTGGEARLWGQSAGSRQARSRIGYLPENHRFPRHLTGRTALEFFGELSGMPLRRSREKMSQLLSLVKLQGWENVPVRKYSKGMQQRLGIAQSLLHEPELVILDEPTDGVDPVGRSEIRALLKQLKTQGKTILINSHLLQEVELVCDRVAILDHGRLQRLGSVAELTQQSQTTVAFHLAATEQAAAAALGEAIVACRSLDKDRVEVEVDLADQSAADRAVDALRAAGISIVSMTPRRLSLEEAFMDIVTHVESVE